MVGLTNRSTGLFSNWATAVSPVGTGVALALSLSLVLAIPAMAWVV